jgi:hypothetical protein
VTRTPVRNEDIVAQIVTLLNTASLNGGTIHAVAQGHSILVSYHVDAPGASYNRTVDLQVR